MNTSPELLVHLPQKILRLLSTMLLFLKQVRSAIDIAVDYIYILPAGRLEDALEEYKRSQKFGVERAAVHIRNVGRSASRNTSL